MRKGALQLLFALLLYTCANAQVTVFPNFTNFETQSLCGTSCTGSCNPTGTWRNADQWGFAQAGTDWLVEDGATPSTSTGPDVDHTLGTSGGKYMYTETSGCNNVSAHLVSDILDFSALSAPKVEFWYHMYGATMGTMHFDVDTTGLGNWVLNVTPQWTDNNNIWQQKIVNLAAYAGRPSVRLRIRAQTGSSFTSDAAVDDINIFDPVPYDLEAVSVNAGGGCGNSSTTPVTIQFTNAGADSLNVGDTIVLSFQISGNTVMDTLVLTSDMLPGDTLNYTFVNGFADLSGPSAVNITAWTMFGLDNSSGNDTTSVSTFGIPIITSYPYFENFEGGQNGWRINNGNIGTWAFGTPAKTVINSASSGVNCFVTGGLTGNYLDNDQSYVEGPCFDFTNICDPVISLRVWWNAEFSWDGMNVVVSTNGGSTWSLVGAFGDPLNWYTDNSVAGVPGGFQDAWSGRNSTSNGSGGWVTAKHRLSGLGGQGDVKIRIYFGSDASVVDEGVAFDDIRITNGPWIGDDQIVCSPATLTPDANVGGSGDTYLWSTGATTSSITVSTTGWYSVTTTGPSCATTDSIYVVSVDANTDVNLGADTTACGSLTLDAGYWPGAGLTWSTGATTQMVTPTSSGTYSVDVVTACGTLQDTIVLTISTPPVVNLGNDTLGCGSYMLDAGSGGTSYLWSNSATTSTITVTTSGSYSVVVSDSAGCSGSDSVMVTIATPPTVNVGPDLLLCNGASATLDAGNPGSTYAWSNNQATQTISVNTAATYSVVVTDSNGCTGNDDVIVTTGMSPTAGFNFNVGGAGLSYSFTSTSSGATTYAWAFGDGGTSIQQNPSHTYAAGNYTVTLVVTNDCGSDTTTQSVTVVGLANEFANGSVQVFPNPSNGQFRVTFDLGIAEEVTLTVQNLAGQVIYHHELGQVSGRVIEDVRLQALAAGMYMVRLQSSSAQSTRMLRVE